MHSLREMGASAGPALPELLCRGQERSRGSELGNSIVARGTAACGLLLQLDGGGPAHKPGRARLTLPESKTPRRADD